MRYLVILEIPGGDSHMKQTGMLVVSLRGVNFGFWSRLGCSGQSANILSHQGHVQMMICLVPLCAGLWVSCLRLYWYLRNNIKRTKSDGCQNTSLLADVSAWPVTDFFFDFFFWIISEHARKKKKELALEVNKSPYARSTISREKIEGLWTG